MRHMTDRVCLCVCDENPVCVRHCSLGYYAVCVREKNRCSCLYGKCCFRADNILDAKTISGFADRM